MPESQAERVSRQAREAVNAAVKAEYTRRQFTISKFGRHPDGYLHARVVVNGQAFYFHLRYGSWLAPGEIGSRTVLKEPEALVGSVIGREIKFALSDKAAPIFRAERLERERKAEEERRGHGTKDQPAREAEDAGVDDEATAPDRVRAGGDPPDDPAAIQRVAGRG